jgi:hypothetical protein
MIGFTLTAKLSESDAKPSYETAEPNAPTLNGESATPVPAPRMVPFGFGSHLTAQTKLARGSDYTEDKK